MSTKKIYQALKTIYLNRVSNKYYNNYISDLMSNCNTLVELSENQKKEIDRFYKQYYGKKLNNYLWHQYYYSLNNFFSEKYIPNDVLEKINSHLFDKNITTAFDDKNLYSCLFSDTLQPQTIIKRINGYFYKDNKAISENKAIYYCSNLNNSIIKPTVCSCNGNGVDNLNTVNGVDLNSNYSIEEIFQTYGNNFIIQERINQHHKLSKLNPSSVNTIRIVTYRRNNDIELIYAVMRIGKSGSKIDNTSAGGMTCKIHSNGKLDKFAYSTKPSGKFESNGSDIIFKDYTIPKYDEMIMISKELHYKMPYFIMVGWDLTVNDEDQVVFVEMNAPFGLHQPAAGPGFGNYTEEILEKCFLKL